MRRAAILALALAATPLIAQEDDRDFLTAFFEDNLSGAGREVTITGFAGALSARATIETLTIADDDGIWLTISGATLDWSRSALLSGEVRVSELSAREITMTRLPAVSDADSAVPSPEAAPFSLPELPVSIDIDSVVADRITLGETILGQPFEGSLSAALSLVGGDGSAALDLTRTDAGPSAEITLEASYSNATRDLALSLDASESAGGIVVGLLGIPGAPSATLQLSGAGPLENHKASIRLATDGQDRLTGTVILGQEPGGAYRLQADVAGNIAPILAPDHVDFFGTEVSLSLDAHHAPSGRTTLDRLSVKARSVAIEGRMVLAADGLPEEIEISGSLADPDGTPVLLPFGDSPIRVDRADFRLAGTSVAGKGWKADISIDGLTHAAATVGKLSLAGSGRIGRAGDRSSVGGTLRLAADDLIPVDAGLAAALGQNLRGGLRFHWLEGDGTLNLTGLDVVGEGFGATGALQVSGLDTGLLTSGNLRLTANDLSRFSALAGRPLGGSGEIVIDGSAGLLSGTLDGTAKLSANGLTIAIDEVDSLLRGPSTALISVLRDTTGTTLRAFDLTAGALTAQASGRLATEGSSLSAELSLPNLSALGDNYGGSANLTASFDGTPKDGRLALDGSGRNLRVGDPNADRILAGNSTLSARLGLRGGAVEIDLATLTNPQATLSVSGRLEDAVRKLTIDARLANLGLVLPNLEGPLVLNGSASQSSAGYTVDAGFQGPADINGTIRGTVAQNLSRANLAVAGVGRASLTNLFISPRALDGQVRYDVTLNGPFRPSALSGRVTLSNGRFSDPGLGVSLEGIEALAQLQGGQARVSSTARLSTGGLLRVDGPIGLEPPFQSRLSISLDRIRLVDPELYETTLGGSLNIDGPLAGGALVAGSIQLFETEIRVSDSGFASAGALLNLVHINEPGAVRETRIRAGLIDTGTGASAASGLNRPFRLDLTVSAPARVFVRGRGIDAELGGQIRLLGTTDDIVPSGQFSLIRGRLDILGKRLVLSEAELALAGRAVPTLRVVAENRGTEVVSRVTVEGPADDPVVSFSSVPELPQEEVLAQLLFGRDLGRLSAFQVAQLANAVAVLAGRGGEGIVTRLRNSFGLDDLDLTTNEDGSTALTAGRYLSENLYSEIELGQDGQSRVTLNLDLSTGLTVRGRLENDGDSGIGIFVERDY
jgi:translocation and assembly module TamB